MLLTCPETRLGKGEFCAIMAFAPVKTRHDDAIWMEAWKILLAFGSPAKMQRETSRRASSASLTMPREAL
jgi:hypothetical protein